MTGNAIWKGNITFGSVAVPVKLHAAVKEERIQFHLLHRRDHEKLKRQMICAYEGKPVPSEEQTRGFELEEGKYILVDPEELERAEPEASRTIEVHEFVAATGIDPIFRERTYYLEPDENAGGYNELVVALAELRLAGVCTWTMRKRSYLGAIQPGGRLLQLTTLRHADEVVAAQSLGLPEAVLSAKELKVGSDLIAHLSGRFQPQKFVDEHQQKLQDLIARKARGEAILIRKPRRLKPTAPGKLLEVLRASLKRAA